MNAEDCCTAETVARLSDFLLSQDLFVFAEVLWKTNNTAITELDRALINLLSSCILLGLDLNAEIRISSCQLGNVSTSSVIKPVTGSRYLFLHVEYSIKDGNAFQE